MNKLLGTPLLAVSLVIASGAYASSARAGGLDGFAGVEIGRGHASQTGPWANWTKDQGPAGSLSASVAYTAGNGVGAQFDLNAFKQDWSDSGKSSGAIDYVAHLYYRNDSWLAGVFGQRRVYREDGAWNGARDLFFGVEGQLFRGDNTFYGQLGAMESRYRNGLDSYREPFVELEVRHFLQDDWVVFGSAARFAVTDNTGYSWHQHNFALGSEYRFSGSPFSVFADIEFVGEKDNDSWSSDHTHYLVGVKYNFGKRSLRQRDRDGASLTPLGKAIYL